MFAAQPKAWLIPWARRLIAAAAAGAAIAYIAIAFDWSSGFAAALDADWLLVAAAGLPLLLASWAVRAVRWRLCVRAVGGRSSYLDAWFATALSQGVAAVTPGQAGEAIKLWLSRHRGGVDLAAAGGSFLAERAADVATLAALTAAALLAGAGLGIPPTVFVVVAALAIAAAAVAAVLSRQSKAGSLRRLSDGLVTITTPPARGLAFLALTILSWLLTAALWHIAFRAAGVETPLIATVAILGIVTFASILTFAPGGIGVSELGIAALLAVVGAPPEQALAAALVVRALGLLALAISAAHWIASPLGRGAAGVRSENRPKAADANGAARWRREIGSMQRFTAEEARRIAAQGVVPSLVQGLTIVAMLALPAAVLLHLDRGAEFSDGGFYYVSIRQLSEITREIPQFGAIWRLLPLPDSIFANRLTLWVVLAASGGFLAMTAWALAWPARERSLLERAAIGSTGAGLAFITHFHWSPEPSYNSIAFVLAMATAALGFRIARLAQDPGRRLRPEAFFAGAALLALAFTRQPTALGLGVLLPLIVLLVGRPSLTTTLRLALWGLIGGVALLLAMTVLVEPTWTTLARLQTALEVPLDRGWTFSDSVDLFNEELGELWSANRTPTLALAASLAVLRFAAPTGPLWAGITGLVGMTGSLGVLLHRFWTETEGMTRVQSAGFAGVVVLIGLGGLIGSALALTAALIRRRAAPDDRLAGIVLTLNAAAFAMVFLTGNNWIEMLALYAVFPLLALGLLASPSGRWDASPARLATLAAALVLSWAAWKNMSDHPYRLNGPLAAQTVPTALRDGHSVLKTDPATHDLLEALSSAAQEMGPLGERPVLIDLTGRLPLATYHMGAEAPGTAWLLSGYPGSQALFDWAVGALDDERLREAWLLDSPGYSLRHGTGALARRGLSVPEDYVEAARAYSPYLGAVVVVWRPKP